MATMHNSSMVNRNLIFSIDGASQQNWTNRGANLLTNGSFVSGTDATPSGGHNAQNDIVQLDNPGDSDYVLRQTKGGANTEYQCNPSIPTTGVPIVLSGWYAESENYTGANRMFHSRAYDGSGNISLGTGIANGANAEVEMGGVAWQYRYATLQTRTNSTGTFNWYVGYAGSDYSGARYYTNLKVQEGRSPCPVDLANNYHVNKNYCTYNATTKAWTFNGTDSYMDTQNFTAKTISSVSVEALIYDTKANNGYRSIIQHNLAGDDALYINPSNVLMWWPATASTLTVPSNQWVYVAASRSNSGITYCVNGVTQFVSGSFADPTDWDFLRIGGHGTGDGERFQGSIAMARVYETALTENEMKKNFQGLRGRYGI
jgi:hypothetical protein